MSKNLKIIQTIFLVAKIVYKVLMVLSIVSAALCGIGIICYAANLTKGINWLNVTINGIINNEADLADGLVYASLCDGILMGAASAVVCGFNSNYCKNELAAGTPFTQKGAKDMLVLAVINIAASLGAKIISSIVGAIICAVMGCDFNYLTGAEVSVSAGLFLLVLSFVFGYGAEVADGNKASAAPAADDVFSQGADNAPDSGEGL